MTTTTPRPETEAPGEARTERPRLAEGVELLGPYENSGYREPPLMVRRPDNQLVQLPPLLYLIAERSDGSHDLESIGQEVGERIGREVAADDVKYLVDEKLSPLGIVPTDGPEPESQKADPLLGLKLRKGVVAEEAVGALARIFSFFFWPPVLLLALAAFVAFDVWLFFVHGLAGGAREALYRPGLLLLTLGLVILAAAFHETGHAAACRYGGAKPGVMGVGMYIVWPAFYTDVTDAYRLSRGGRLRTDLGGVYFNALFVLVLAGVYALTGLESLLLVVLLVHFEMAHQMLPFLRLDGYYVVADLVGVPDLFQRIRPILTSFLPWAPTDPRVSELKPWVRFAVTGWVMVVVPIIVLQLIMVVTVAPRLLGTAWDSMRSNWTVMTGAWTDGRWIEGLTGILQLLLLILPIAGIVYLFWMLGARFVRGWRETKGRPLARSMLSVTGAAFLVFIALAWWPEAQKYEPIQPGERWTVPAVVAAAATVPFGAEGIALIDVGTSLAGTGQQPAEVDEGILPSASPSPSVTQTSPSPSTSTASPSVSPSTSPVVSSSVSPTTSPSVSP
jgi:putative peptide zinc metalloprotease protein